MTTTMEVQLLKALQDNGYFGSEDIDYQVGLTKRLFIRLHEYPSYVADLQQILGIPDDVQRKKELGDFTEETIHLIMDEQLKMPKVGKDLKRKEAPPLDDEAMEPPSKKQRQATTIQFLPWVLHEITFPPPSCVNYNTPRFYRGCYSKQSILASCKKRLIFKK